MDVMDFTLKIYKQLLTVLKSTDYNFITFEEYCSGIKVDRFIILRHDVDKKPKRSLALAQIEASLNIKATYYFRIVPQSNQPEYIRKIATLGHEIGYHYEDLSLSNRDIEKAYEAYRNNLAYFRTFYPVKTISMHGSPTSKYDNRDLWKTYDYREFEVIGEPYFDFINAEINDLEGGRFYFTDTAGMWDGDRYNVRDRAIGSNAVNKISVHTTSDLIKFLVGRENGTSVMINTHPQRWTDSRLEWLIEYFSQRIKNVVKGMIVSRMMTKRLF